MSFIICSPNVASSSHAYVPVIPSSPIHLPITLPDVVVPNVVNTYSMQTRAKSGIIKPKVLLASQPALPSTPTSFQTSCYGS